MELVFGLLPVFIVMILSLFMSKKWEMREKVDKGITLCYWKLSYRRKFIRTLWMIPISIVVIFCFHSTFQSNLWICLVTAMLAILLLIQAVYNYRKWKNKEYNREILK